MPLRANNENENHYKTRCNEIALLNYSKNLNIVDAMVVNSSLELIVLMHHGFGTVMNGKKGGIFMYMD